MSNVSAETPSNAQQKVAGTNSTKAAGGGLATERGAARTTPPGGALDGWMLLSLTVAFIGESGVTATRAVSLRGPVALARSGISGAASGMPGLCGIGGATAGGAGGSAGVGASNAGGGRTGAAEGGRTGAGPAPGGRLGKVIRAVSLSLSAGFGGAGGGNVIRTVSFLGSFKSAMYQT